ncbi:MAG: PEGA domain-containing protein [Candidatus Binatia bacterium]
MRILSIVVALAMVSGCATLFKSKTTDVQVSSSQPGATVMVDGQAQGTTPTSVTLSNKVDHVISVDGQECRISSSASTGWVVLSVLAGGVGWIIDLVTGNWKSLDKSACSL